MTTKFGKQIHLQDLTQMRLIKQVLVTSSRQDQETKETYIHYESANGHQTWQDGNLPWLAPAY